MPGNKKNRLRAEPAIGTTNVDLSRTTPLADPRFQQGADESEEETVPSLAITGRGAAAKVAVPHQKLPDLPAPKGAMPFTATRKP